MFSELPKLFDRDFAIGFFLPIACFFAAFYGLLDSFHLTNFIPPLKEPAKEAGTGEAGLLVGTTIIGLATWLFGVLLLVLNRLIYRLFEGYIWPLNTDWARRVELQRLKRLRKNTQNTVIEEKRCRDQGKTSPILTEEGNKLKRQQAERFPDLKIYVLSTAFGNTIRVFERYPKIMYGIESTYGWPRLLTVIPKDFRQLIDSAKAQTDFWLNLWLLSYLFMGSYVYLAFWKEDFHGLWLLFLAVVVAWIASVSATAAAGAWGSMVKTAFDVFLPDLYKKLGFTPSPNVVSSVQPSSEWETWNTFSQAIIYRFRPSLPPRMLGPTKPDEVEPEEANTSE